MKKLILFFGGLFLLVSCASTKWSINGDITTYNSDGTVLRQWDNVIIESGVIDKWAGKQTTTNAIKTFGFNFTDPKTNRQIIISNAVPCIIEYEDVRVIGNNAVSDPIIPSTNIGIISDKLSTDQRREIEKGWIYEIRYDIANATTKQDLLIIKNKIVQLSNYSNNLPKKNYLIEDALASIEYDYKQKIKKLGLSL